MMLHRSFALAGALSLLAGASTVATAQTGTLAVPQAQDAYFVAGAARAAQAPSRARAKNVVVFIGDGMGVTTVTAARILAGQRAGRDGESHTLTIDTFPHTAFSRTYSVDLQISESASTATAILSGIKTKGGGIGLTAGAGSGDCGGKAASASRSLIEIAENAGLATGVVTTARITQATPAAAYAHVPNRNWETDGVISSDSIATCADIARQLIEWPHGDGLEVAFGGGRLAFLPMSVADPEFPSRNGVRVDERNLIGAWAAGPNRVFVSNATQLAAAAPDARVLGLFSPDHMAYENDRARAGSGEPSLKEMTVAAIRRLQRDPDGFVLVVDGGRIDHGHHEGRAAAALSETIAFDEAIRAALDLTSRSDTLIVVTAGHSHTLTMSGYARRGTPILGLSTTASGAPALANDRKPYTTLGYMNGPGAPNEGARPDLSGIDTTAPGFHQQALVPTEQETHGGEDVPIYAWGPSDANFAGTLEQHAIFHLTARALGFSFAR